MQTSESVKWQGGREAGRGGAAGGSAQREQVWAGAAVGGAHSRVQRLLGFGELKERGRADECLAEHAVGMLRHLLHRPSMPHAASYAV